MRILRLAVTGTTLCIIGGCADGRTILDPAPPALAASPAHRIETAGQFDAIVDFSTLTLTPTGRNCRLDVDGQLVFSGTIVGTAIGHTSALVFASCSDVATNPPGTFKDVFRSELVFQGTVTGQPAQANVLYMGGVEPGGRIDGRLVFSNGVAGRLEVDARVAVGGDYAGSIVVR